MVCSLWFIVIVKKHRNYFTTATPNNKLKINYNLTYEPEL